LPDGALTPAAYHRIVGSRAVAATGEPDHHGDKEAGSMDLITALQLAAASGGPWDDGRGDFWFLWPLVPLFWIVVLALVLRFVVFRGRRYQASPMDHARGILADRYARGEIDAEEYRRRSDELR
jgi:putative membrane protein